MAKIEETTALLGRDDSAAEPLVCEPVSAWANREPPLPRDWICEGLGIGAKRVTSLIGNGGFGKSTIVQQFLTAVATGQSLFDLPVRGGPALGIFCEDEPDELERKQRTICSSEGIDLASLDNLHLLSRDGADNVIAVFERDQLLLTGFYWELDATIAAIRPRVTVLDTTADLFAGDFMSTPHVRQFIKTALGGLCVRHGTAIVLVAHPSASAMASGDGGGFSTAWNNSVRSRLYLRRPKSEDADAVADRRVLEVKKSNYGPAGQVIPLIYQDGRFVLDPDPVDEGHKPTRAAKSDTRLALAVMAYFRERAASGQVVAFRAVFEALQASGEIARGSYETVRKPLQRTLKELVIGKLLTRCEVPRGYRIVVEAPF